MKDAPEVSQELQWNHPFCGIQAKRFSPTLCNSITFVSWSFAGQAGSSKASHQGCRSSTKIWNQEMECCCHVVLGYLCWYSKSIYSLSEMEQIHRSIAASACFSDDPISTSPMTPPFACWSIGECSAPFAVTPWTSLPSNTKPTLHQQTTMVCRLRLETAATFSTWIVSNVGWKPEVFVHCVIRSGILPRLKESQDMGNWESKATRIFMSVDWDIGFCILLQHAALFLSRSWQKPKS